MSFGCEAAFICRVNNDCFYYISLRGGFRGGGE